MTENELATIIVDSCYKIHKALGPGLLESVYEIVLEHELKLRGLAVERQVPISIVYEGLVFEKAFQADLVVEDKVIIECKSIEEIARVHPKKLLTYLRLTNKRLGLLVNFGKELIKDGIKRVVNNLDEE
jgi:GxxExxY protein